MVKVIIGLMGASVAHGSTKMSTPAQLTSILNQCQKHKVHELDTARVYGGGKSESLLGACAPLSHSFGISTKAPGFSAGSLSAANIEENCRQSLEALGLDKVDIYYFHGPDRQTPFEEQCRAMNRLYGQGKFERFGVSNLRAEEVERIYDICKREGYVLPSVYQGGYNPLLRRVEFELFPTLKRLGMHYYAFSPLGGGYFSRSLEELRKTRPEQGSRMAEMPVFKGMYVNERSLELLERLTEVCERNGMRVKEATLRWLMNHGALGEKDGVILGASSLDQVEENLTACEAGPLPEEIVQAFEEMWKGYRDRAPPYCP